MQPDRFQFWAQLQVCVVLLWINKYQIITASMPSENKGIWRVCWNLPTREPMWPTMHGKGPHASHISAAGERQQCTDMFLITPNNNSSLLLCTRLWGIPTHGKQNTRRSNCLFSPFNTLLHLSPRKKSRRKPLCLLSQTGFPRYCWVEGELHYKREPWDIKLVTQKWGISSNRIWCWMALQQATCYWHGPIGLEKLSII